MTRTSVQQAGVEVLLSTEPRVEVSQAGVEYLFQVTPGIEVSQAGVEYLFRVQPQFGVYQAGVEYLYKSDLCVDARCQIWTITRTDGVTIRFTSLNRELEYMGETYQSCGSLSPTATENVAGVDEVGNMDLTGLLLEGFITFHSLHAGLYNGAEVEAWLVSFEGEAYRKPLLRGKFGNVEYTENTFTVEIEGDGARLQQTPLIRPIERPCHWQFGDSFCTKDLGSLEVSGTVEEGVGRRNFTDSTRAEGAGYFRRGKVTFTSGLNSGISAEVKEHTAGGIFTLWPKVAYPITPGTTYTMTPGCTNQRESALGCNGCDAWANFVNYGGKRSIPGRDKVTAAAEVRKQI